MLKGVDNGEFFQGIWWLKVGEFTIRNFTDKNNDIFQPSRSLCAI